MSLTTNDLATHLNMSSAAAASEELQRFLNAAIKVVEGRCGPIRPAAATMRCRASGKKLVLPVTNLRTVVAVRDPDGATVEVDARRTNLAAGIVEVPTVRGDGFWEVDVTTGADQVPADLELAVFVIASHLYEIKRGRSGRPEAYFGGENSDTQDVPKGFAVPARAAELMRAYIIPAFA